MRPGLPLRVAVLLCGAVLSLGLGGCASVCGDSQILNFLLCRGDTDDADLGDFKLPPLPPPPNLPPTVSITPASLDVAVDERAEFTGSWDDDGTVVAFEWDLDGDGAYETTGTPAAETRTDRRSTTFSTAGMRLIRLRVVDDRGWEADATASVSVTAPPTPPPPPPPPPPPECATSPPNQPPDAAFSFEPPSPQPGQQVSFDASDSADPDAGDSVVGYRWDFGDGTDAVGETPLVQHTYTQAGTYTVRLVVVDESGACGDDERDVQVQPPARGHAVATAAQRTVALPFSATLSGAPVPGATGRLETRGPVQALRGMLARGRFRGRTAPVRGARARRARRLVAGLLRARWRGRLDASLDRRTGAGRADVLALATFPRRRGQRRADRACLRIAIADVRGRRPTGTLTLLGGTGAARRLGVSGTFELMPGAVGAAGGKVRVRNRRARGLPAPCRRLRGERRSSS